MYRLAVLCTTCLNMLTVCLFICTAGLQLWVFAYTHESVHIECILKLTYIRFAIPFLLKYVYKYFCLQILMQSLIHLVISVSASNVLLRFTITTCSLHLWRGYNYLSPFPVSNHYEDVQSLIRIIYKLYCIFSNYVKRNFLTNLTIYSPEGAPLASRTFGEEN